jgi:hypothetical protein
MAIQAELVCPVCGQSVFGVSGVTECHNGHDTVLMIDSADAIAQLRAALDPADDPGQLAERVVRLREDRQRLKPFAREVRRTVRDWEAGTINAAAARARLQDALAAADETEGD